MAFEPVFPAPAKPFRQLHGSSLHLQVFPLRAVCASAGMLDISRGPVLTLGHLPPFRSDQLGFSTMQINTQGEIHVRIATCRTDLLRASAPSK